MAKDKITMPSGSAGITRYWEGDASKVTFSPGHVIILSIVVIVIIIALHMFGNGILGI